MPARLMGSPDRGQGARATSGGGAARDVSPDDAAALATASDVDETGAMPAYENPPVQLDVRRALLAILPSVCGIAFSRVGCIALGYGSYRAGDLGLMTDAGTLICVMVQLPLMLLLARPNLYVGRTVAWRLALACIALQTGLLLCYDALGLAGHAISSAGMIAMSALSLLCFTGSVYFWLRHARGADGMVATMLVMLGMALSVVIIYGLSLMPLLPSMGVAAVLTMLQLPLIRMARRRPPVFTIRIASQDAAPRDSVIGSLPVAQFAKASNLVTLAMGITIMGFTMGVMRGFPVGAVIAFQPATRLLYSLLTVAGCLLVVRLDLTGSRGTTNAGMWVIVLTMASVALVLYALFPGRLDVGLAVTNAVNALMVAYVLRFSISFSSAGTRDAYYYCLFCMTSYLGPRAIMRTLMSLTDPLVANMALICSVVGLMLLLCAQVVFLRFMYAFVWAVREVGVGAIEGAPLAEGDGRDERGAGSVGDDDGRGAHNLHGQLTRTVSKALGMQTQLTPSKLSEMSLKQLVDEIARIFLLSDREADVMLLYAQGVTQARIAERLGISANTVHAHIKRIYAKCNVHSRQELLDLMHSLEKM